MFLAISDFEGLFYFNPKTAYKTKNYTFASEHKVCSLLAEHCGKILILIFFKNSNF